MALPLLGVFFELYDGGCLMGLGTHGAKLDAGIAFVRDTAGGARGGVTSEQRLSVAIQYSARCEMQDARCEMQDAKGKRQKASCFRRAKHQSSNGKPNRAAYSGRLPP